MLITFSSKFKGSMKLEKDVNVQKLELWFNFYKKLSQKESFLNFKRQQISEHYLRMAYSFCNSFKGWE